MRKKTKGEYPYVMKEKKKIAYYIISGASQMAQW